MFTDRIDALSSTLPLITALTVQMVTQVAEELKKAAAMAQSTQREYEEAPTRRKLEIITARNTQIRKATHTVNQTRVTVIDIPRSFLITLVSQFDTFLGGLIRTIYSTQPKILNISDKNLPYSELLEFNSLTDAREYIIEREVDLVLRGSHEEQLEYLEKRVNLLLREQLAAWPKFIELTERRNLYVHTNGLVSQQYLSICKRNNVPIASDCKPGQELNVSLDYFHEACDCVYEVAVILAQLIWRKLLPTQIADAEDELNELCVRLLQKEKYKLAKRLLIFATENVKVKAKTSNSEQMRLILLLNKAQAYKWSGEQDEARKIIEAVDWSAYKDSLRLGAAVLTEDYDQAVKIMESIGVSGEVSTLAYKTWPIFRDFRQSEAFLAAYFDIFDELFIPDLALVSAASGG